MYTHWECNNRGVESLIILCKQHRPRQSRGQKTKSAFHHNDRMWCAILGVALLGCFLLCLMCDCSFCLDCKILTSYRRLSHSEGDSEKGLLYNLEASHAVRWQMTVSSNFGQDFLAWPCRPLLTWLLFLLAILLSGWAVKVSLGATPGIKLCGKAD